MRTATRASRSRWPAARRPQGVPLLRIGDYAQITDTPYWVPPPPVKQLCAGFSETLGPGIIWPIDVNGVPESPYEVAVDGAAYAPPPGAELASGVSSTATSLSVEVDRRGTVDDRRPG